MAGEVIDLISLRPVLDEVGEPHLLRLLKSLEDDDMPPSAGFNSVI